MIDPHDLISGENLASRCDYIFSQTRSVNGEPFPYIADYFPVLKDGDIVFCKTDFIDLLCQCFDRFLHKESKIAVITHDSDYSLTEEIVSKFKNPNIHFWGMNCETVKANPIPIGIANSYCKKTLKTFERSNPTKLLYINHRTETHPEVRKKVYDIFSNASWATVVDPSKCDSYQYKLDLLNHKFIACPRGNGVDTHRIWEALYCGVIPIVIRHRTHSLIEGKLPILFVDSYEEVNEKMLTDEYHKIVNETWNLEMLKSSWWIDTIKKGMA